MTSVTRISRATLVAYAVAKYPRAFYLYNMGPLAPNKEYANV